MVNDKAQGNKAQEAQEAQEVKVKTEYILKFDNHELSFGKSGNTAKAVYKQMTSQQIACVLVRKSEKIIE